MEDWDKEIGLWVLVGIVGFWVLLLIFSGIRRWFILWSCATNKAVIRRWGQFIQVWWYSFLFTMNYLSDVACVITLALAEEWVYMGVLCGFILLATVMVTTVDVIGDVKKSAGHNPPSIITSVFYLLTLYLPRVVWKSAGHPEVIEGYSESGAVSANSMTGQVADAFATLKNHITPKTGDVKDIVGIQAVLQSAPALFIYITAIMQNRELESTVLYASIALSYLVLVTAPILGDWVTARKDYQQKGCKLYFVMFIQFLKRIFEVAARMGFYVFFHAVTNWGVYIVFAIELFLMYHSYIKDTPSPKKSRFSNKFHKFYMSMGAVIFGFYRRLTIDKNIDANTTMMPAAIELIRYIIKFLITAIGYFIIIGISEVQGYFHQESKNDQTVITSLFFIGVGANVILLLTVMLIEFLCCRRKDVKKADFNKLFGAWKEKLCAPCANQDVHITRDYEDNNRFTGDNQFTATSAKPQNATVLITAGNLV